MHIQCLSDSYGSGFAIFHVLGELKKTGQGFQKDLNLGGELNIHNDNR